MSNLTVLLGVLTESYQYAAAFNIDTPLRLELHRADMVKEASPGRLPSLLPQEEKALGLYLKMCEELYFSANSRENLSAVAETRLMDVCEHILASYTSKEAELANGEAHYDKAREVATWGPIVISVITILDRFSEGQLRLHLPRLLWRLYRIGSCRSRDLREALRHLLTKDSVQQVCLDVHGCPPIQ